MPTDRIPFEDASFDAILSNQVLEHVPDIEVVARELARVLKPGGMSLHLFPHLGVWREPHTRVPFLHWLSKHSWRVGYAALMRPIDPVPDFRTV
jgi:ubiquinone/menaquinone biosynthesis C-methylase UbiE